VSCHAAARAGCLHKRKRDQVGMRTWFSSPPVTYAIASEEIGASRLNTG